MAVYRETYTKPLPEGAELFTKGDERFARWTDRRGKKRTAKVTTGRDGSLRVVLATNTHAGDLAWLRPPPRKSRRKRSEDAAVGGGAGPSAAV